MQMLNINKDFLKNITLLYVEDDLDIADEISELLECYFHNIHVAHDGEEGLNLFKKYNCDIVLTDIQMPEMDGFVMAKHIREISPDTPIVISSAFSDASYLKQAIALGISNYLIKPINIDNMLDTLDKILLILHDKFQLKEQHKELIKAKNNAINANKAKSEFLANMSHEIRTPLNAINGFIEIIADEFDDEKLLSYISVIDRNSESLLGIINDILDFNKIESGKLDIVKEYFELQDEIKHTVDLFKAKASQKNITLALTISKAVPYTCKTDSLRLKQILSNLLSNAIKFTNKNGDIEVKIDANKETEKLYFSVKDNGMGISDKYQKTIFDPFSQEDLTTTKKFGGTGLGLSICHKLVDLLGGELNVKSQKGNGSEFYFNLPAPCINDQNIQDKISKKEKIKDFKFNGNKILLVEDNESNQMFMSITLKKLGLEFDIANDGVEAIEQFKLNVYDAVLMDENMPNLNGIEATKQILEYEKENNLSHTPIIALTANALKGDRERFLEAGMNEYLTKPLNKKKLSEILGKFLV
ncbi:MAG: hypothetical protein DRG78_14100 [Epsilonproteobacteria bacterium]|nr:MAG: hypothetical protein DRG78_14100 [Campylobacterota bacterium]